MSIDSVERVEDVKGGSIDFEPGLDVESNEPVLVAIVQGADVKTGEPAEIRLAWNLAEAVNVAEPIVNWSFHSLGLDDAFKAATARFEVSAGGVASELPEQDGCGS